MRKTWQSLPRESREIFIVQGFCQYSSWPQVLISYKANLVSQHFTIHAIIIIYVFNVILTIHE